MQIITVNRIIDDNGIEVKTGDSVFLKLNDMYDALPATVDKIMTSVATFMVMDPVYGLQIKSAKISDVRSITKKDR